MEFFCPISIGELVDKLTILEIKKLKIQDEIKLERVEKYRKQILKSLDKIDFELIAPLYKKLFDVNLKLWEIEDLIRVKEANKDFGEEFIDLARSVYLQNDKRFEHKNNLNKLFKSTLHEVKSFSLDYQKTLAP